MRALKLHLKFNQGRSRSDLTAIEENLKDSCTVNTVKELIFEQKTQAQLYFATVTTALSSVY